MKKIAVIGGGPSGLFFALLARRRFPRAAVEVFEQNPAGATFGFGIILAEGGLDRFRDADPEAADAIMAASRITRDRVFSHNGDAVFIEGGAYGGAIARIKLLNTLQDLCQARGIPVHYESRIENPDVLDAELIVGADGVNSVVRRAYEGQFGSSTWYLTNRMAWYGTTRQFPSPILSFRTTPHGHFWAAAYPHSQTMSTFVAECDADAWTRSGLNRMTAAQRMDFSQEIFAAELEGHPLLSNRSDWVSLPVIRCKHWSVGHRVLIGDALHSPHPSIGSGTRIAMEDAIALIGALADNPDNLPRALAEYQRRHTPETAKLVDAMEKSYEWYEQVAAKMDNMDAITLAFDFMTRTGRLSPQRLYREYPKFMRKYEAQWNAWQKSRGQAQSALAGA
ncbi:monooxygenase [Acidocella aquatica]|uniref:Monooxygenase n=1 Tax=Acidocella aquatica TaxID=1922313 RepID=A0ABQ5ZZG5_9PROT|nr:FAD-dependent monooxygenase [Acidocella aquatica]GLR65589.1 monooxygenase [Acidocella aquatica]